MSVVQIKVFLVENKKEEFGVSFSRYAWTHNVFVDLFIMHSNISLLSLLH